MPSAIDTKPLKKGDKIVLTSPIPGVPEGETGKVLYVNGMGPWMRAWVRFKTGEWVGSVSAEQLVREKDWPAFQEERKRAAEEALKPKPVEEAAPAAAAVSTDGDGGGAAVDSRVPAHLLERSRAARARKTGAA